jgi:hypothetical protein
MTHSDVQLEAAVTPTRNHTAAVPVADLTYAKSTPQPGVPHPLARRRHRPPQ